MTRPDDIVEVVDEIVDDIDPIRFDSEACRLWPALPPNLAHDKLLEGVITELKARLQ